MQKLKTLLVLLAIVLASSVVAHAQAAATASISGKVTDPQGAGVPGASVQLIDSTTNQVRTQETGDEGQYLFSSVPPAVYKITVTKQGFKQAVISSLKADVSRSHTANVGLEIGNVSAVVEVTTAGVELQKLDATVGNVLGGDALKLMPSLTRDATTLILLQPMVTPRSNDEGTGGQVAGARSDQNTFQLDGGDATSNTEGNGAYNTNFIGEPHAVVPTPQESLEEFRVATNNQNAAFGRSAGGQVSMVTKRGT
ncbi:MAG: carboxypeptidase regulatory-like domain-containing protein, partial [Pyrinomonadaceae bacterium]